MADNNFLSGRLLYNTTGQPTKKGFIVKANPKRSESFILMKPGDSSIIGIIADNNVPSGGKCNVITAGEAYVYVKGKVDVGDIVRAASSEDKGYDGVAVKLKSGGTSYLRIGTALQSGKNKPILCKLDIQYILLDGGGVQWDDIRIAAGSIDRPGIDDPTWVNYQPGGSGTTTRLLEFAKDDIATFTVQIPHSYKLGSDIYVHVHWTPGGRGTNENGNYVGWKVDYSWASLGSTFGTLATADLSDVCDGTNHKHQMTPDVKIDGSGKGISSMLICNIKRTDTGTDDTWVSTTSGQLPMLLEVDFHFQVDSLGSRERTNK